MAELHEIRRMRRASARTRPASVQAAVRRHDRNSSAACLSRRAGLALTATAFMILSSVAFADEQAVDRSWRLSGGISLLPGSDGDSRVGYGLTLSRSFSRRTTYGAELTSSFGSDSGDVGSTRIHTLVGGFLNQSLYGGQGIVVSAGLSAGLALASVRELDVDDESTSTEAYPYVEPRLSASLSLPGASSRFSGSIGWITLPGEDFSEPRFSFGFSF